MNLKIMPTERSQIHKTSNCKLHLCVISRPGKLIETDQCGCPGLGVAAEINCEGARGQLLWADGNVLKLGCGDGCNSTHLLKLLNRTLTMGGLYGVQIKFQ